MDFAGFALFLLLAILGFCVAGPLLLWSRVSLLRQQVKELEGRLRRLEGAAGAGLADAGTSGAAGVRGVARPASAAPAPGAVPSPSAWIAPTPTPSGSAPSDVRAGATFAGAAPREAPLPPPAASRPAARTLDARALEDTIGATWMQNLGAVLLLLGTFLFILWGYSTGRMGAGVLVATGVGLGLVSIGWGDRLARSVPRLGHAFIGVGFGAVSLSLYLGHFTLQLLPRPLALGLLLLTSAAAFAAGLRHRAPGIAALGVVGAFIPQLFAAWFSLRGFTLEPPVLLAYLAVVDLLVFALAARAGWSGLDLAALVLTTVTWLFSTSASAGSWPLAIGLYVLYAALGFAPLPPLLRAEGRVRSRDLAVVAGAPVGLILTAWPWLSTAPSMLAAVHLLALSALYLGAAAWVDSRRPERDLWRPLTGAAVVFLTAGLQRLVGETFLALTWGVEGVILVVLGMAPRSGWLRFCGHIVTVLAVFVALGELELWASSPGALPVLHADSLRGLGLISLLVVGAALLARGRDRLAPGERWMPEAWTLVANILLLPWTWARCRELTEGRSPLLSGMFPALIGAAWFSHAFVLVWRGARAGGGFLRFGGYVMTTLAVLAGCIALWLTDHWSRGAWPVLHPEGLLFVAALGLGLAIVALLARRRGDLTEREHSAPEWVAAGYLFLTLLWSAREAGHLARFLLGELDSSPRGQNLSAALTSAAWLAEAILLLVLGWQRVRPFLRWAGLAVLALTLLKFMFYDLATADVFWRFLTAIAAGAAMLAVSFAYQRRQRVARTLK